MDLQFFCKDLEEKNGIFYAKNRSPVSYPEDNSNICFQIEENSFWFKHRNDCIAAAVKKYAPDNIFFDIGGGNGFVAKHLENNGVKTVLVEPNINGAKNAKERKLKNIICSTLDDARFKKNSISAIGLFDVVEHIEDDVSFLTNIFHCLADHGLVFITVPAYTTLWSHEDKTAGHFRRYTKNKIAAKLKQIGFQIEYSSYIFSILPIPVFLFRTIPSLLGLNKETNDSTKYLNEHKNRNGIAGKIFNKIWKFELSKIRKGKEIWFGGSCFVIARKNCG